MHVLRPHELPTHEHAVRNIGLEPAPPPPLFDNGLGQAFFQMRTKLSASVWDMARLVDTEPTVIANLEAGALESLPAWTELTRIVEVYGALSGTDTGPLIARLIKDYALTGPAVSQPITAHLPPHVPPPPAARLPDAVPEIVPYDDAVRTTPRSAGSPQARAGLPSRPMGHIQRGGPVEDLDDDATLAPVEDETPGPRGRRAMMWFFIALLTVAVGGILAARMQPRILYAAAWPWPQVVRQPLVAGIDWLVVAIAPRRDGLVWIDAGNPAWRKTDKLPEAKP